MNSNPEPVHDSVVDGTGLSIVVAGGGTAGHIEPALAVADAIVALAPGVRVTALGTPKGLEGKLVPARGYQLELIPPAPMPRAVGADLVKTPVRLDRAVRAARKVLAKVDADVVVGFGGYVALPAYLAARAHVSKDRKIPVLIHEANASAGLANKVGARFAEQVMAAVPDCGIPGAQVVGMPVRQAIADLDRAALRMRAREFFGLDPQAPTILVFGGSQGAQRINEAVSGAAGALGAAGIGVLHAHGATNAIDPVSPTGAPAYVAVPYLDRMDLAYAAADLVICRSGAMTVAEVTAAGLPAVYVPLPHGNGEQRLNALPVVQAGAARLVDDADLTVDYIAREIRALVQDPAALAAMSAAGTDVGHRQAAQTVAAAALALAAQHRNTAAGRRR
ncbi:MAG: undecaprenyldiphospho-muramoylpentapeptide beta-N-acetylglucosaminyltransferase [Gordonia sp. (in: high G+C Gram-positive bacteria)]|uniref:undecaprenyldiphospho-muramoylpentapeptide beta-N-acetylglucosaminyltransferase n=1 Tax=Gordonia sp. (in: high G+C Gram-positive bacteria) TaxID=84139 RepID=UPI003BB4DD71